MKIFPLVQRQSPEVFSKKRVSYKLCKFHRKITVSESVFNKVARLKPATLLKRDSNAGAFL